MHFYHKMTKFCFLISQVMKKVPTCEQDPMLLGARVVLNFY